MEISAVMGFARGPIDLQVMEQSIGYSRVAPVRGASDLGFDIFKQGSLRRCDGKDFAGFWEIKTGAPN